MWESIFVNARPSARQNGCPSCWRCTRTEIQRAGICSYFTTRCASRRPVQRIADNGSADTAGEITDLTGGLNRVACFKPIIVHFDNGSLSSDGDLLAVREIKARRSLA